MMQATISHPYPRYIQFLTSQGKKGPSLQRIVWQQKPSLSLLQPSSSLWGKKREMFEGVICCHRRILCQPTSNQSGKLSPRPNQPTTQEQRARERTEVTIPLGIVRRYSPFVLGVELLPFFENGFYVFFCLLKVLGSSRTCRSRNEFLLAKFGIMIGWHHSVVVFEWLEEFIFGIYGLEILK